MRLQAQEIKLADQEREASALVKAASDREAELQARITTLETNLSELKEVLTSTGTVASHLGLHICRAPIRGSQVGC